MREGAPKAPGDKATLWEDSVSVRGKPARSKDGGRLFPLLPVLFFSLQKKNFLKPFLIS